MGIMAYFDSFTIDDDLQRQLQVGIEVTLFMQDGSRRWCYFMRPEALAACGDWLEESTERLHFDAPHMIVVAAELTPAVIERALRQIDRQGALLRCSLLL